MKKTCDIEGCLCHTTVQPITEAVYGKRPKKARDADEYEPSGHGTAVWRRLELPQLDKLADVFPKARRFAARRKDR